ncbi:MAG: hypothetical protein NTY50_05865 [Methylobacter sp.]|nr:hypothetical protein [Methylobacter sp.]
MFNKKIAVLVGALMMPTVAFSGSDTTTQPNIYELTGNNIHISYSTGGLDGLAHFTYRSGKKTLNFKGDQIRTIGTEIGTLVTVTTTMTVDSNSAAFSILLPRVNLDQTLEAPVKTQGIVTQHKFSVIPGFNSGQLDNYKVIPLAGTAKFVYF